MTVASEDNQEEEGPFFPWLPPEDRLWRHPSEVGASNTVRRVAAARLAPPVWARPWSVALCAGAIGAVLALGVGLVTGVVGHHTVIETVKVPSPAAAIVADSAGTAGNWASIADSLAPSIVGVRVATSSGVDLSSGVVYAASHRQSYIITASDVISGGPIVVVFDDGTSEPARLVGNDPESGIALLAIPGVHGTVPTIGSVSSMQIADPVLAVGARTGGLTPVDTGSISGIDQQLNSSGGTTFYGMLAVGDVTLPSAADGGALVDAAGAVVGIDTDLTSSDPSNTGMAFAVPIDTAEQVADQLLAGRRPTHPWIGIDDAADLSTSSAKQLGVSSGAEVASVAAGSPSALAGVRPDDVVTAFAGATVDSPGALVMLLSHCSVGQHTEITFVDSGRTFTEPVTVSAAPLSGG